MAAPIEISETVTKFEFTKEFHFIHGALTSLEKIYGDLTKIDYKSTVEACNIVKECLDDINKLLTRNKSDVDIEYTHQKIHSVLLYQIMRTLGIRDEDDFFESVEDVFPKFGLALYEGIINRLDWYRILFEGLPSVNLEERRKLFISILELSEDHPNSLPIIHCISAHLLFLVGSMDDKSKDFTESNKIKGEVALSSLCFKRINTFLKDANKNSDLVLGALNLIQVFCNSRMSKYRTVMDKYKNELLNKLGDRIDLPSLVIDDDEFSDLSLKEFDYFLSVKSSWKSEVKRNPPNMSVILLFKYINEFLSSILIDSLKFDETGELCFNFYNKCQKDILRSTVEECCHFIYASTHFGVNLFENKVLEEIFLDIWKILKNWTCASTQQTKAEVDVGSNIFILKNNLPNTSSAVQKIAVRAISHCDTDCCDVLLKNSFNIDSGSALQLVNLIHQHKESKVVNLLIKSVLAAFSSWSFLVQDLFREECLSQGWREDLTTEHFSRELTLVFNKNRGDEQLKQTVKQLSALCLQSSERTIEMLIKQTMSLSAQIDSSCQLLSWLSSSLDDSKNSILTKILLKFLSDQTINDQKTRNLLIVCRIVTKDSTIGRYHCPALLSGCELIVDCALPSLQSHSSSVVPLHLALEILQIGIEGGFSEWDHELVSIPALLMCLANIIYSCHHMWGLEDGAKIKMAAKTNLRTVLSGLKQQPELIKECVEAVNGISSLYPEVCTELSELPENNGNGFLSAGIKDCEMPVASWLRFVGSSDHNLDAALSLLTDLTKCLPSYNSLLAGLYQVLPNSIVDEWKRILKILLEMFQMEDCSLRCEIEMSRNADSLSLLCSAVCDVIHLVIDLGAYNTACLAHMLSCFNITVKELLEDYTPRNETLVTIFELMCNLLSHVPSDMHSTGGVLLLELITSSSPSVAKKLQTYVCVLPQSPFVVNLLKKLGQVSQSRT